MSDKRAAILQSCYLPWKGYFDIIALVDVFVIYDVAKFSKNHWYNRNLIKTQHGLKWLTVPVLSTHGGMNSIDRVKIAKPFTRKHWKSIAQSYARAPFFKRYSDELEYCFDTADVDNLSSVNVPLIKTLCRMLMIDTEIVTSRSLVATGDRTSRLINICRQVGARSYLSGAAAKGYIDQRQFSAFDIELRWMDYSNYPSYPQLHGGFAHNVSAIDLLFNTGPNARNFMKAGMTGSNLSKTFGGSGSVAPVF